MLRTRDHSHFPARPFAGESWHFDALSDDGREALVITFNENYQFSPRAFRASHRSDGSRAETFPAVTLTYAVGGRIVLRAVNEFESSQYRADGETGECRAGTSSFRRTSTDYGAGFVLDLELLTPRKCRIKAEFEWLSIETPDAEHDERLLRAVVAPRSDVSGRIVRIGRNAGVQRTFHFRGTGFLDHTRSNVAGDPQLASSLVGRAHFVDSTAIFQAFHPDGGSGVASFIILVKDGETRIADAKMGAENFERDRYGLVYPGRIEFDNRDVRLRVTPVAAIESGFFKKIMTSEITLMTGDGKAGKTMGLVEFTEPGRLKNRVFRWLSDLRIGRSGRAPLA